MAGSGPNGYIIQAETPASSASNLAPTPIAAPILLASPRLHRRPTAPPPHHCLHPQCPGHPAEPHVDRGRRPPCRVLIVSTDAGVLKQCRGESRSTTSFRTSARTGLIR
uniref:Uncharacterized protein n=1 Tax=Oryza meridionalis TaxID=40149 RepID=A0A0E0DWE1_9ORYZ